MDYNMVGWFEVPVTDMERAITFYQTVFNVKLERHEMGDLDMAWFPFFSDASGAMGALVRHAEWYKPSADGTLVYFNSRGKDLDDELSRIEAAGGTVLQPKTLIAESYGYMAIFFDSEGNRVALHSME
ncbi:MAG: VOC family protein [Sphingobacteriales bacterium]|jgi:predicted enzyme related to lactoylglutathione lyase|nr:VOC family protein [Sphingobacteriales bacterium]MCC7223098.1 VOC family protein [Chitinophagales bacterium]